MSGERYREAARSADYQVLQRALLEAAAEIDTLEGRLDSVDLARCEAEAWILKNVPRYREET